jgi:hypothetical protein
VSTIEDQLRAAGRAVAEQVTSLPELQLTPKRAGLRGRWARNRHRWTAWGTPLAAMGLVAAVAVALVVMRGSDNPAKPGVNPPFPSVQGTPPAASQVPRYYIAAELTSKAIIGDLRTGKEVAAITPAAGHLILGVTGAADDSTFVLDMPAKGAAHQFFLYRPAKAGGAPLQRSPLTLKPSLAGENILGLALSPDGRSLAVYSMATYEEVLRVYSVATGRVQRQWTMPTPSSVSYGGDDNSHSLTWTDNGQAVAFRRDIDLAGGEIGISVFVLNVSRPGHDLRADSRVVKVQSTDNQCKDLMVSPDGTTVICGVESGGGASASCPVVRPGITEYSAETGKLIRVLYEYKGDCTSGMVHIYWTSPSGSAVVANLLVRLKSANPTQPQYVNAMDLVGAHGFAAVPLRLPGETDTFTIMNGMNPVAF